MTESELIEGCLNKKQRFQKLLFDRFAGKMMSVCLRYANDEQQAQDILQEGFIKVFNFMHQYKFEGSFEGWMRRVFATVAMRLLSKQRILFNEIDLLNTEGHSIEPTVLSKLSEDEIHLMIRNMPDG